MAFVFEDHNDWMDQSTPGLVRDAAHTVGLHLVRKKKLDDPSDVLHLTLAELKALPKDARALVAQRKAIFEEQSALEPPETIGAAPEPGAPMIMHDQGRGQEGNVLHGIAASSGTFTGRARVFLPGPIPPDVDDGDILVAVDAGPDWTPVFAILGAVVLDKGAAWQHAGVVAREFGIPAVTGTTTGTEVIADGSTITVDGDAGTVQLAATP
jgi:pyruvate,water dikinase